MPRRFRAAVRHAVRALRGLPPIARRTETSRTQPILLPDEPEPVDRNVPFPQSLCHACAHVDYATSSTTTFVRCRRPGFPKYPPQPLRSCRGHEPRTGDDPKPPPDA